MSCLRVAKPAFRGPSARSLGWRAKPSWLPSASACCLLLCSFVGCPSPYLTEQKSLRITEATAKLDERMSKLEATVSVLSQETINVQRIYWSEKLCQKSRDKIVAFVNEVQKGSPAVCKPMELEKALAFMNSQPVAYVYLDKNNGLSSLHPARAGYIRDNLLNEEHFHPSTRVLVLAQPYGDSPAAVQESQNIAKALVDKIKSDLPVTPNRNIPILGPYLLPCNLQSEALLSRLYGGSQFTKLSESLPGEPTAKQPRVRIWVFRTDCQ